MTPELAKAINELRRARIEAGSQLARNYPDLSVAIDRVLQVSKASAR